MTRIVLLLLWATLWGARADTLDFERLTVTTILSEPGYTALGTENLNHRLLLALADQSYDRDLTVQDFLALHPRIRSKLERIVLPYQKGETRYSSSGQMLVEYLIPLSGVILKHILPPPGEKRLLCKLACPCCGQPWPQDKPEPESLELVPYETGNEPVWTGILVDLRGLKYRPALFPRLVTEGEKEVYGPSFANEKELAEKGMVAYYRSRTEALASERIGPNPLIVKTLDITGTNRCDPTVSPQDAARIHGTRKNLELLAQCRVGFLLE